MKDWQVMYSCLNAHFCATLTLMPLIHWKKMKQCP